MSIDTPPLARHRPRPGPTHLGPSRNGVDAIASSPDSYAAERFAVGGRPFDGDAVG